MGGESVIIFYFGNHLKSTITLDNKMRKLLLNHVLQMVTTVLKKENSPENNVLKLQSISKGWIIPTDVE